MQCKFKLVLGTLVSQRTIDPAHDYDEPAGSIVDIVTVHKPGEKYADRWPAADKWTFITSGGADECLFYKADHVGMALVEDIPESRAYFEGAPFRVEFVEVGARLCAFSTAGARVRKVPPHRNTCPSCGSPVELIGGCVPPHVRAEAAP